MPVFPFVLFGDFHRVHEDLVDCGLHPVRASVGADSGRTFRFCNGKPLRGAARPCRRRKALRGL